MLTKLVKRYQHPINYEKILWLNYSRFLKNDSVIVDVGAHHGMHTINFLNIAKDGAVIAIEPLKNKFSELRNKTKKYNNIHLFNLALSNYVGVSEFIIAENTLEESGLKKRLSYNEPKLVHLKKTKTKVEKLDNLIGKLKLKKIDYIKIDIEGGEIDCLKGGIDSIKKYRPYISVEYSWITYKPYGHKNKTLYLLSQELGYTIVDIFGYVINTMDEWLSAVDKTYWDFYLIPKEKVNQFVNAVS
ncbi:MAG: FkbM family methyltransferase [Patescibacteria group bacterium]